MKKLINICLCLMILLLSGCHQAENVLKLKYNDFHVELGNAIVKEPLCYLDLSELTDDEINSIREKADMTVEELPTVMSNNKTSYQYENVGTYLCTIQYFDESVDFKINVVSTLDPIILGPNTIAVKKGDSDFNFDKFYTVKAPYYMQYRNIDTSQVNFNKVGDYQATVLTTETSGGSGQRKSRNITVKVQDKVIYQIPARKVLNITYYNQMDYDAPNGCEATSLYMALKYKKKMNTDIRSFIGSIPQSYTPYEGFSGDPFSRSTQINEYYTIFPQALISATYQYAQMRDISGSDIDQIMDEIASDHPVIAWVTGGFHAPNMENYYFGKAPSNLHIVLVSGYDQDKKVFYIKDPANRELTEVSFEQFQIAFDAMKYAMVVEE
ncbi:C39 family peptidase [Candidatus Stoquefichus massiliensis]|uniref:C39 family peptidase n=1 Tax=Candidatus Stoquefichus massiliensis TaxID=1470350 RepID=UPI0004888581|nr:C39 family peptidase [Candidatus Stoquefichus massiliensis]